MHTRTYSASRPVAYEELMIRTVHRGINIFPIMYSCVLHNFTNVTVILLVGKPEGKRPLGRQRRRWEDNIKMDLQEVGGGRGE